MSIFQLFQLATLIYYFIMASSPFEMGTIGLRRLKSELKNFKKDPEPGVEITEIEEDFSHMDIGKNLLNLLFS